MKPITIDEIYQFALAAYFLGIITMISLYLAARLWHQVREDRRRRDQFKIHRRTPFGV